MSPALPSYTTIKYNHSDSPRKVPKVGEIIALPFSQDLFGPGSDLFEAHHHDDLLPSHATRYNYHHAVVICITTECSGLTFTIFPVLAYSSPDPVSSLSSTNWLLAQSDDFQQLHIPLPFEEDPGSTRPHPTFKTPERFGPPLQISGWKSSRPSWVQAVPQAVELGTIATFKCFEPRVMLNPDDVKRLMRYCIPHPSPSSIPLEHDSAHTHLPGRSNDASGTLDGPSLACKALYANDAVNHPLALATITSWVESLDNKGDEDDDDSDDDSDSEWVEADLITFARHYAATIPFLAKVVEDHDQQMRELSDQRVANWLEGVSSLTS